MKATLRSSAVGPLLLRFAILASAAVATLLSAPRIPWLVALAVIPAVFVRFTVPDCYLAGSLIAWILTNYGDPPPAIWRVCVLALMLYYLHAASALSAVMPMDANFSADTLWPWLARIGVVTAITVALSAMVAGLQHVATGDRPVVAATYAGMVALVALAVFLVRLARRG
ncbi:MAG TPA: hypothetical protein VGJ28_03855 [Micromonosporaceae bacterium]|jgi:hypothetical protein